jgi:tetratricopeptide (TPR) repeat protein
MLWQRAITFVGKPPTEEVALVGAAGAPVTPLVQKPPGAISSLRQSAPPIQASTRESAATKKVVRERAEKLPRVALTTRQKALRRNLVLLGLLAALGVSGWLALRFDMTPDSVRATHPFVATRVAEAHLRVAPQPTPFALNNWMRDATSNRYANRILPAAALLRQGIATEPDNLTARFMLSDILRDDPGTVTASQAIPDMSLAQVAAQQAASDVPDSPHAQWARAMYAALAGDAAEANRAAELAADLDSSRSPATVKARRAEIAQRLGATEEAIQLYESALLETDYVPWRAEVVRLLRSIGRDEEVEFHLSALRAADPDHPLVTSSAGQ